MRWVVAALLACAGVVAVAPATVTSAAADEPDCHISAILVNSCRPWVGATSSGYGPTTFTARMADHESRIGRQLDVVHTYLTGAATITPDIAALAKRSGTIALVNWRPVPAWANGTGGNATVNTQIDNMAKSIKALGTTKIMLAIHHEPENDISPGGDPNCALTYVGHSGAASDYVAMWHNVRKRFDALGVNNVVWVMNYMGWHDWNCVIKDLWPGNDYVDWVTWDPYPRDADWRGKVGEFYDFLTANSDATHDFLSKPWGLSEFAYAGTNQTQAYQLYDRARQGVQEGWFPKLKMLSVWDSHTSVSFDDRVQFTSQGVMDQTEQDHYNAFVNDPLLTGSAAPAADTTPPTVTLTSPQDDATGLAGSVNVTGTATDSGTGVASAQLLVDDAPAGALTIGQAGALTGSWNTFDVGDGDHTLRLRATDVAGNTRTTDPITVTVANGQDQTPPSPPGNLTAEVDGADVALSWSASTDDRAVASYKLYRDGALLKTLGATTLTYTDTGLADNSFHSYTVNAVDKANNESADSNEATAPIADNPPAAPVAKASLINGSTAHLTWTAPAADDLAGYDVYRNNTFLTSVGPGVLTYDDTGLPDGKTFGYTVVARDAGGNQSVASNRVSVTTPDVTLPSAPTNLVGSVSGTTIKLTWKAATDNVGVKNYTVYRNNVPIGSPTTAAFTDSSPRAGAATYVVQANDAAGNQGPSSNTAQVTFPDKVAPTAPSTLKGVAGVKTATLTWTAASDNVGVVHYYVYRGGVKYKQLGVVTRFVDSGLVTGRTYAYRVYAIDAAGNSSVGSNQVSVKAK